MNTDPCVLRVGGLSVHVVRRAIKNLHLGVYPPNGRVRVAAPLKVSDDSVRLAVIGKLGWIKRQQGKFLAQIRQPEREMVSGESHYFLGRRYRLHVVKHRGVSRVVFRPRSTLELHVRAGMDAEARERALQRWYRQQLRELASPLLEKWQRTLGVKIAGWGIKRMKTKWGTCTVDARRVWLNLELVKKPVSCLEYVVVHELVHLIDRQHDEQFLAVMDQHLPQWRRLRQELNSAPLAHVTWKY
ncbi:MAG: M48 family metallopeptidase [Acidobacteria bacterium]|nr:M48 family metallopeptidase [Acidobacteriota bacterium]